LLGIAVAVILGLSLLAARHLRKKTEESLQRSGMQIFTFFGLSSLSFVTVLVVTYLLTLPTIDIDNRMLLPLYAGCVMAFYGAFSLWQAAWFRKGWLRVLQILPLLIAATSVAWYYPQAQEKVKLYHPGDGLTAYHWDHDNIIQAVRDLPDGQPVISNDWELLLLWTQRPIYGFWNTFPSEAPVQTTAYGTNPGDRVQTVFCQQGAALVIFDDFDSQFSTQVSEASSKSSASLFKGLTVYGAYQGATIYLYP
jgi:hypothetical protein